MLFAFWTDSGVLEKVAAGVAVFLATTVLSFVVGRWWGRYQAKRHWQNKQFLADAQLGPQQGGAVRDAMLQGVQDRLREGKIVATVSTGG
jgi:hypothetical protein